MSDDRFERSDAEWAAARRFSRALDPIITRSKPGGFGWKKYTALMRDRRDRPPFSVVVQLTNHVTGEVRDQHTKIDRACSKLDCDTKICCKFARGAWQITVKSTHLDWRVLSLKVVNSW